MRRGALLLLAGLLAACSSGGGADRPAGMSAAQARAVIARAQLTVADLGDGWRKTDDKAGDSGNEELTRCAEEVEVADETLVAPRTRTFEHTVDERNVQQVVATTAVLRSAAEVRSLLRAAGRRTFAECFTKVAADSLDDPEQGVDGRAGQPTITETTRGVEIVAPVELHLDAETEPVVLDVLLVDRGQTLLVVAGFSLGQPLPAGTVARLGGVLAGRVAAS